MINAYIDSIRDYLSLTFTASNEVFTHPISFNSHSLNTYSIELPAVSISLVSVDDIEPEISGNITAVMKVQLDIITESNTQYDHHIYTTKILNDLLLILVNNNFNIVGSEPVTDVRATNEYNNNLNEDVSSIWGVSFSQKIELFKQPAEQLASTSQEIKINDNPPTFGQDEYYTSLGVFFNE